MAVPPKVDFLLDTSCLVKVVVDEPGLGTERVRGLIGIPQIHGAHVTQYTFAECLGVLKAKLRRREIVDEKYGFAIYQLSHYFHTRELELHAVDIDQNYTMDAVLLARSAGVDFLDAFHFVTLRKVPSLQGAVLTTCDRDLVKLAKQQRVPVWNPDVEEMPAAQATFD